MKHYVKIINYMTGESIEEQLMDIARSGLFDDDLRVFFANNNTLTTKEIATVMKWFAVTTDEDFHDNIVFAPSGYGRRYWNGQVEKEKEGAEC